MEGNLTLFGPEPYSLSLQSTKTTNLERYLYCTLNVEHVLVPRYFETDESFFKFSDNVGLLAGLLLAGLCLPTTIRSLQYLAPHCRIAAAP